MSMGLKYGPASTLTPLIVKSKTVDSQIGVSGWAGRRGLDDKVKPVQEYLAHKKHLPPTVGVYLGSYGGPRGSCFL